MSKIIIRRFRVYGSQDQYTPTSSEEPLPPAITHDDCPALGDRTTFYFGSLPEIVIHAEHVRAALSNYLLNLVFRGLPEEEQNPERGIQAEMARIDEASLFTAKPYPWWTTIVIERTSEADLTPAAISALEKNMNLSTEHFLDLAVMRLALAQQRSFYRERLMDRVFFYLPDRLPFVITQSTVSAKVSMTRPLTAFPLATAQQLGDASAVANQLASPSRWYLESLNETDTFKSFLWAFFSMESLVNKLADLLDVTKRVAHEPALQDRVRALMIEVGTSPKEIDLTKSTPFLKFAAVSLLLNIASAKNSLEEFQAIKKFRGKLAHGEAAEEDTLLDHRNRALAWLELVLPEAMKSLDGSDSTARAPQGL